MTRFVFFLSTVLFFSLPLCAELKLAPQFSDHMVLQRGMKVPIWGWTKPGSTVAVSFADTEVTAQANEQGKWRVVLAPMKASSQGRRLTVRSSTDTTTLEDVLVGEVWLASGQSNMEWPLFKTPAFTSYHPEVDKSLIRVMTVEKNVSLSPEQDLQGVWMALDSEETPQSSATASFFAMNLVKELNVPVGILSASWGGILIEPMIPKEDFLERVGPGEDLEMEPSEERLEEMAKEPWEMRAPGIAYNAMIAPLAGTAMRGALWYQGESNVGDEHYEVMMKGLIGSWRQAWGQGDFSFYIVQLASYRRYTGLGLARMWEAQSNTVRDTPRTGMAVLIDNEQVKNIHPKIKPETGRRLALLALAKDYGKDMAYSGPVYKSMTVEGHEIHIEFDHVGGGLLAKSKDGRLHDFEIAGEDRKYVLAEAKISGEKVIVSSYQIEKPVAVRYAWTYPSVTGSLFNKDGLPASAFRSDSWPLPGASLTPWWAPPGQTSGSDE